MSSEVYKSTVYVDGSCPLRRAAIGHYESILEADVREALQSLDPLWDELFPTEQSRVLQLLVERVDVHPDGLDIKFRVRLPLQFVSNHLPSLRSASG